MCESLEDFASIIQSPFEHDCVTNSDCSSIRCELDIFGNAFSIGAIVLPCIVPPAIEVLVIDLQQEQIIFIGVFNRTEERTILVLGTSLPLDVIIVHHEYSMDIQVGFIGVGETQWLKKSGSGPELSDLSSVWPCAMRWVLR